MLSLLQTGAGTKAARVLNEAVPWKGRADGLTTTQVEAVCVRLGIPRDQLGARLVEADRAAARAAEAGAAQGLSLLTVFDPAYPPLLRHIPDPPIALWTQGNQGLLDEPAVAIIGSRKATTAGLALARQLARDVSRCGLVVVSGLARGIDGAAHQGALDAGGPTVAVVANGLDIVYPAEHRALTMAIARDGLIISEFPPGTRPFPAHFPLRNRIITGLCRAVVVVEAGERSGSLITARAALDQGRDVLAVPGPVAGGLHRGCHALIKDGARLVESVEDILEELGWRRLPQVTPPSDVDNRLQISKLEDVIGRGEVLTLDDLAARSGRPAPELLAELGRLELAGRVARLAGGTFARLD